jgi:OOP family OmpA-OmpF porin
MLFVLPIADLLSLSARAQDGFDAHGFVQAANDGEIFDPLVLVHAEKAKPGVIGVDALFEYASDPLVLDDAAGNEVTALLGSAAVLNLGGQFGISNAVSVGVAAPVYLMTDATSSSGDALTSRAGLGDVRISLPISVISTDDGTGFHVSLVPYADLPSGDSRGWVGNGGIAGGGIVAARYGGETWDVDGNLGFKAAPGLNVNNLNGGSHLLAGLGAGYALTDWLGVRAEAILQPTFTPNAEKWTESPGEAMLSFRGSHDNGFSWTVGGATGLTKGASAAKFRVFAGIGYRFGKLIEKDTDGDGLVDSVDACVTDPETVNAYKDDDGCPDKLADAVVTVVDSAGKPIADAKVTFGGKDFTTDATGKVTVEGVMPATSPSLSVAHAGYTTQQVGAWALVEGPNEKSVTLPEVVTSLAITVKSDAGKPVDAKIALTGPNPHDTVETGADGTETVALAPGHWALATAAQGFDLDKREVDVAAGETKAVEIKLTTTLVKVTTREIEILEQVQFDTGSDVIKPESFGLLDQVAKVITGNPQIKKLEVQGHTDDVGSSASNDRLSQKRVDSVVRYLVSKGVNAKILVAKGYGESKPLVPNTSDENRAKNRRVQFVILEQDAGGGATGDGAARPPSSGTSDAPKGDGASRPPATPAPAPTTPSTPAPAPTTPATPAPAPTTPSTPAPAPTTPSGGH